MTWAKLPTWPYRYTKSEQNLPYISPLPADSERRTQDQENNSDIIFFLFAEEPKLLYLGCYIDKSVRAMDGLWFDSNHMTADLCVGSCKAEVSNVKITRFLSKLRPAMLHDVAHCTKAAIRQLTTMLSTSKNVLFPGHFHMLITGADAQHFDYHLSASKCNKVKGHQHRWLAGGYDLEIGHF